MTAHRAPLRAACWRRHSLACLLALLLPGLVAAHDSRPLYIELLEQGDGRFELRWKLPPSVAPAQRPRLQLSANCTALTVAAPTAARAPALQQTRTDALPVPLLGQRLFRCSAPPQPAAVLLDYAAANPSLSALLRLQRQDAPVLLRQVAPGITRIDLTADAGAAASQGFWPVLQTYGALGVRHIVGGYDHLLFVAALVLLAGTFRRIAWAVTGFTLAHSVTLALAALGYLRLPAAPVEAAIALSVLLLAAELARSRRDTLTWRYPIGVSLLFGLLHGLGFASVLAEIGLPRQEVVPALLAFNLGVELGQLGFVLLLLMLLAVLVRARVSTGPAAGALNAAAALDHQSLRWLAYPIGTVAAFWFLQRLTGLAA